MLTVQYARALDGILVNAADPGFTSTEFNKHRGTQTVTEGTDAIVRLATLPPDGSDRRHPGPAWFRSLVDQDQTQLFSARRGISAYDPHEQFADPSGAVRRIRPVIN